MERNCQNTFFSLDETFHKIINNFDEKDHHDLMMIMDRKLCSFLKLQLYRLNSKRTLHFELDELICKIYNQECNRYFYNPYINAFYEIINFNYFSLIPSDKILFKLKEFIPPSLNKHKIYILKTLRQKIKENVIFNWVPSRCIVHTQFEIIEKLFMDRESVFYFMTIIGDIILNNKKQHLIQNSDDIHLWMGNNVPSVIQKISSFIYRMFRVKTGYLLDDIRLEYNLKYPLSNLRYLYFPSIPNEQFNDIWRYVNQKIEIFLLSCCFITKNHIENYKSSQVSPVNFFRLFTSRFHFFDYYMDSNLFKDNGSRHVLLFNEIVKDFCEFLKLHHFPPNLMSFTELKACINEKFQFVRNGNYVLYKGDIIGSTFYKYVNHFINDSVAHGDYSYESFCKWMVQHHSITNFRHYNINYYIHLKNYIKMNPCI